MYEHDKGPKSELARYAYGYSNKKPSLWFWIIYTIIVVFVLWNTLEVVKVNQSPTEDKSSEDM